ncbi:MAG: EI24 domain-containing protein, partial [Desulfopila sp.]|nr:EI24 domain-containing protein [Desulfopila sp.]
MAFLFRRKRLVGLSALLFLATIFLTWLGYQLALDFIDSISGTFFATPPETATILGWLKHKGWVVLKWLYLFITRIVAFYLAFIIAYTLTSPGYVVLSTAAEKLQAGDRYELDDDLSLRGILLDMWEGLKIAGFGIIVTIVALLANFIPLVGQIVAFLLYTYYSALMFLDYPASRRRWSLGRKLGWLGKHRGHSFRLGLFPALISMIPIVNIFIIALLFPIL